MQKAESPDKECQFEFKQEVSSGRIKSILSPPIKNIVMRKQWNMDDHLYRDLNLYSFFESLRWTAVQQLWLSFNKRSTIITEIIVPVYPNLKRLMLSENHIVSIEPIINLYAPSLQRLFLDNNKIVRGKSLRKAYFPELIELNMNGNLINDESWLIQCKLSKSVKVSMGYPKGFLQGQFAKNRQGLMVCRWFLKGDIQNETVIQSRGIWRTEKTLTRQKFNQICFEENKKITNTSANDSKK